MKFDRSGNILWQKIYTGSNASVAYEIVEKPYNGKKQVYTIVGSHKNVASAKDIFVLLLSEDGTVLNLHSRGTNGNDEATGVDVTQGSEDPVFTGYTDFYGTKDIIYTSMDFDGAPFFTNVYDGGKDEEAVDILSTFGNRYQIAGNSNSFSSNGSDDIVFFGFVGSTISWFKSYGTTDEEHIYNQINYGGTGVGYMGYYIDQVSGLKKGLSLFTDWGGNNEGSHQLSSCSSDEVVYDRVLVSNGNGVNVASSNSKNGSSDFVLYNASTWGGIPTHCLADDYQTQGNNRTWSTVTASNDFIARPFVTDSLKDSLFVSQDFVLAFTDFCSSGNSCALALDISPEDTLVICTNTTLSVVLEECESIVWTYEAYTPNLQGLESPNLTVSKSGWVTATKTKDACSIADSVYIDAVYGGDISFSKPLISNTSYCLDQTTEIYSTSNAVNKFWAISVPTLGEIASFTGKDTISYTFSDSLAYTVRLTLKDDKCPISTVKFKTLNVIPLTGVATKDLISCTSPALISASSNGNVNIKYSWNTGQSDKSISIISSGQYIVTKTWAGTTCQYTDTINLTFAALDTVAISSNDQKRCELDTLEISLPETAKSSNWSITNLTNLVTKSLGDSFNLILPLTGGFFRLQNNWIDGCNTAKTYQKDIDVYLYPVFSLEDTTVCGVIPTLDPKIPSFTTWETSWSTGAFTKTIVAQTSGKYILTTKNGPCVYKDSSQVTIKNSSNTITPTIQGLKQLCLGDTAKFYVEDLIDSIQWVISSNGKSYLRDTIRFIPSAVGSFTIKAYSTDKCEFNGVATSLYEVGAAGNGLDIKDTSSCDIQSVTYTLPSGMDFYRWSTGATQSVVTITNTGQYFVEYGKGICTTLDSFFVELSESSSASYSSSKRSNIWIFGENAGLDFNYEPPKPFANGKINTEEGCSSICDEYGNLLFYTDGTTVFNRSFVSMPNGNGLYGHTSSTHSSIVVPHPGNSNLYYIFTSNDLSTIENKIGFNYSIVDMSLQNGFGDIIIKNQKLFDYSTEKIAAVESADGQSIWVVAHESTSVLDDGSNRFFAYNVGINGLDLNPIISSVGHMMGDFAETNWGQMKISPNGKKLAVGIGDVGLEVFDFDANTGKISNPWFVDHEGGRVYGVEFSPNSEYVYFGGFAHSYFDQYRVAGVNSENEFKATKYQHKTNSNVRGMQLAPNGKIYVIIGYTGNDVSAINNPNEYGDAINLGQSKVNISGKNYWTFPSVNTSYSRPKQPFDLVYFNACVKDEVKFTTNSIYQSIEWNFGDGAIGSGREALHKYDSPGVYTVKAKYNAGCDEFTKTIEVSSPASATVEDTLGLCANSTILDAKNPLDKVYWYKYNSNILIDSTQSILVKNSGDYMVKIKHENCLDTSYFNVYLEKEPDLGIDTFLYNCFEDENLTIEIGNAPKSYRWIESNLTNDALLVTEAGRYLLEVTGDSLCKLTKGINVVDQCKGIVFVPNAFTPNLDNLNDDFVPFTKFLTKYEIQIYNQWGELVFVSDDEAKHWDGTYKGIEALEGIYTYVLNYSYLYKNEEFSEEKKGFISLIK